MELNLLIYKILNLKGVGRVKANRLVRQLKAISEQPSIIHQDIEVNLKEHLDSFQLNSLFEEDEQVNDFYKKAKDNGVKFLNILDKDYPASLKSNPSQAPTILSCLGNINLLKGKKIGFCGSRKASEKGLDVAKDITQQVAEKKIIVVSGYASGIDQQTHYWALKENSSTIIVLPEGINHFTLKTYVKNVWDWERVLVVSEFAPNAIWSAGRAMERNATIIGLSDVMVLIEAREKGGSIDAGNKTLNSGKPLFAPVYKGMPEEASGNAILLTKGALPLMKKRETNRANLIGMLKYLNIEL